MIMDTEYDIRAWQERRQRWDLSFLVDAKLEARRSKDPSTKVGAVIVRPDLTPASRGYNGFARGVADTAERLNNRELKLELVVHAEENALLTSKEPLTGYTIYTSLPPCIRCASKIIQAGIARVVTIAPTPAQEERWNFQRSRDLFAEVGVELTEYQLSEVIVSAAESGIAFIELPKPQEPTEGCCCASQAVS